MSKKNLPEWLTRLLQLREAYYTRTWPNATKDHGIPTPKPYKDTTANGLTRCIIDWLNFSGHDGQRVNSTGIPRKGRDGRMKWTKGGGRKGSADIHAIIDGRAASIEVKIGSDTMGPDQIKEQQRITSAGGLYFITSDMASFVTWYDSITFKTIANA